MFVIRMQYISKRHNNTRPRWFADREQLPFLSVFRPSICWLANHFFWKFKRINFIFLFAAQYFFTLRSKKDNEEFEDTRWFCLHCCEKETNTIINWKIHFAIRTNIFVLLSQIGMRLCCVHCSEKEEQSPPSLHLHKSIGIGADGKQLANFKVLDALGTLNLLNIFVTLHPESIPVSDG